MATDDATGGLAEVPPAGLTLQELRSTAELLEREVIAAGRLGEGALDARRPGSSAEYPELTPMAWLSYVVWLAEQKGTTPSAGARSLPQVLHEALADEPERLTLSNGREVGVHPKSLNTLLVLEGLDADVQQTLGELRRVTDSDVVALDGYAGAKLVASFMTAKNMRRFAWILTHPGCGLPFAEDAIDADPADWTTELRADDLERIILAHLRVNRTDIEFLAAAFPSEAKAQHSRLPLSGFLGAQAGEDGVQPKVYLFDRSLRSIFAGCIARAETHRQAIAASRKDAA